jgi:hypothetical protein
MIILNIIGRQAYYKELNLLLHLNQTEQRLVSEFRYIISLFKKLPLCFQKAMSPKIIDQLGNKSLPVSVIILLLNIDAHRS